MTKCVEKNVFVKSKLVKKSINFFFNLSLTHLKIKKQVINKNQYN